MAAGIAAVICSINMDMAYMKVLLASVIFISFLKEISEIMSAAERAVQYTHCPQEDNYHEKKV